MQVPFSGTMWPILDLFQADRGRSSVQATKGVKLYPRPPYQTTLPDLTNALVAEYIIYDPLVH